MSLMKGKKGIIFTNCTKLYSIDSNEGHSEESDEYWEKVTGENKALLFCQKTWVENWKDLSKNYTFRSYIWPVFYHSWNGQ